MIMQSSQTTLFTCMSHAGSGDKHNTGSWDFAKPPKLPSKYGTAHVSAWVVTVV